MYHEDRLRKGDHMLEPTLCHHDQSKIFEHRLRYHQVDFSGTSYLGMTGEVGAQVLSSRHRLNQSSSLMEGNKTSNSVLRSTQR